jgi:hypothetical protein
MNCKKEMWIFLTQFYRKTLAQSQDLPLEVYFSGWEDHQNSQMCGDEAF